MKTTTFEHNGAVVTMREAIGADEAQRFFIANMITDYRVRKHIPIEDRPKHVYLVGLCLANIVLQTVSVEGDLGLTVPSQFSPDADLIAFYEALFKTPEYIYLVTAFRNALDEVWTDKPAPPAWWIQPKPGIN